MKKFALKGATALVLVGSLSGCAALSKFESAANTDLAAANLAIAKADPTVAAFITNHVAQADTYFQEIAATGVFSQAVINQEASDVAQLKGLAGNLPTSVAGVASELASLFTDIQNLTTVPGA